METIMASLSIELNVDCPYCENWFDLLETDLNDEGEITNAVMPNDKHWSDAHKEFKEKIVCPACKKKFIIDGVDY